MEVFSERSDAAWQKTWGSREFIESWAAKGGWQAPIREVQTQVVLEMLGHSDDQPIRVLDIGAGYGALAMAILDRRANATAVCLDASEAMLTLGRERNAHRTQRIEFVQGSLENQNGSRLCTATSTPSCRRAPCTILPSTTAPRYFSRSLRSCSSRRLFY